MAMGRVAAPFRVFVAPLAAGVVVLAAPLTSTLQAEFSNRGSASRRRFAPARAKRSRVCARASRPDSKRTASPHHRQHFPICDSRERFAA
jgi:hypothetical protein